MWGLKPFPEARSGRGDTVLDESIDRASTSYYEERGIKSGFRRVQPSEKNENFSSSAKRTISFINRFQKRSKKRVVWVTSDLGDAGIHVFFSHFSIISTAPSLRRGFI
jgi:hypothetical protein